MVWHLLLTGSSKRWHFTRDYLVNLGQVVTYVFELPFSRAQETEADEVCSSSSKGKRGRVLSSLFIARLRLCKLCVCHDFTFFTSEVGLLFAAKACFDVREAPAFWGVMQLMAEVKFQHLETASTYIDLQIKAEDETLEDLDLETAEILAFASTHPADLKRQANFIRIA